MKSPIIKVSLGYGYSDGFFSRLDYLRPLLEIQGGFDIGYFVLPRLMFLRLKTAPY
jgi:hypothetical protein